MKIERPIACLITTGALTQENFAGEKDRFIDRLFEAAEDGVDLIQIREKSLSARNLSELAADLAARLTGERTKILINDRADIAAAIGCAGVHLTTHSLPVAAARTNVGTNASVSCSTHTLDEVRRASDAGADIILFGPIFATPGKGEPVGLDALSNAVEAAEGAKVLALGGIDETNFSGALEAGAAGIAAIRALNDRATRRAILGKL